MVPLPPLPLRPDSGRLFISRASANRYLNSCRSDSLRFPAWVVALICCLLAMTSGAAERQLLRGHVPAAARGLNPTGDLDRTKRLNLAIGLPLRNQEELRKFLQEVSDPSSAQYRQYLTPEQFAERFGPTEQDYQSVMDFARRNGLTVKGTHSNRMIVDVEGAVPDIEKALHTRLRTYKHPKEAREFYAPDAEPSIDLQIKVLKISGLDNYSRPRPHLRKKQVSNAANTGSASPEKGANAMPNSGSGPGGAYMGNDFRTAYVPGTTLTGSGQAVGLLQFDGYNASDITYYENKTGRSQVTLTNVLLDGFTGKAGANQDEVCLDIEMVIAMAPGISNIVVYEADPNTGLWVDILNRMATDNLAKQLSCSWGESGLTDTPEINQIFQQMAAQGQSFFNASGDSDAFSGLVDFPSDNPYITQVGGVTLITNGTGGSWTAETVWNWGSDIGSGGGISTQYPIPSWQQGVRMIFNRGSNTMRNSPDVALTADNVYVRASGTDETLGGTSCAAPLWAAYTALVNQQATAYGRPTVGFINPAIYKIGKGLSFTSSFHDTTIGDNYNSTSPALFPAATGYDLCTGWGTPSGTALINALAGAPDYLLLSGSSFASTGSPGGPFTPDTNTYTLTNTGTTSLTWTASKTQTWLTLSATSGMLASGSSTTISASLSPIATGLMTGTYSDSITFTDVTSGLQQSTPVRLAVAVPAASMVVLPATDFAASGAAGAAFSPETTSYFVSNAGTAPLNWSASSSVNWISLSATSGILESGSSIELLATVNSNAIPQTTGTYSGSISFANVTNGNGNSTRPATLTLYSLARYFNLDSDPGWSRQGEWAFGVPQGGGGVNYGNPDPTAGATGANVFGVNLSGDYLNNVGGPYYLLAGPFNFTGYTGVMLQFQRWLNTDFNPVIATLEVSNDGTNWTTLFSNPTSAVTDSGWTLVRYDISTVADNHSSVYVRWGHRIGSGGTSYAYSGWNIDDIAFMGTLSPPPAPTALVATGSNGMVCLNWAASGGATSKYNLKRSLTSGSGHAVLRSPTSPGYNDTEVTNGNTYYYVVSAVNAAGEGPNSPEVRATPDAKSLITLLRFDEGNGTTASDSTGHGWNGTLVNGAGWTSGKINKAVSLTAASHQYVSLPSGLAKGVTDFTIAAWANVNSTSSNLRIFDFGTSTTPGSTTGAYVYLTPRDGNGKVRCAITTAGYKNETSLSGSTALPTGTWTHVAVTLSGSTGTLYVNGVPVATNSAMALNPSSLGTTTQNYLGKSQYSADSYLDGAIDQFLIYSRALTAPEISVLATAPSGVIATGSNASVIVSWNALRDATGYSLVRSLTSGSGYSTVAASVSGTNFTDGADTGLTNGTTYYYQVTALNGVAESPGSAEVFATPDGTPPVITVPAAITATATGANGAIVIFSTSALDAISGACPTTNVPASGSLFPIGTSSVTTTAVDGCGNVGSASFSVTVQTLPISPNEQHSSSTISLSGSSGTLSFNSPVPGHTYQLQYCDDLASGTWQNNGAAQVGDTANLQFQLPVNVGSPRRFYRIQIQK